MNRNRENRGVISKDRRGAIPVMHVGVNYYGLLDRAIRLQLSGRHRHIMDCAETFTMPRMRMMKSPAEIRSESVTQRRLCGENASTRAQPNLFDAFFLISNFQPHPFSRR